MGFSQWGIYAWIIFEDDDRGTGVRKRHCICQCTFPKSNQIISVHSEYFVLKSPHQKKKKNHRLSRRWPSPWEIPKKSAWKLKKLLLQSKQPSTFPFIISLVRLFRGFSLQMEECSAPTAKRYSFFSPPLSGADCFLTVRCCSLPVQNYFCTWVWRQASVALIPSVLLSAPLF